MRQLTCTKCGWVHMGVSLAFAENAVAEFNKLYEAASQATKDCYGGPASMCQYEKCFFCGAEYTKMRPTIDGDAPDGVTIQPIIDKDAQGEAEA